MLEVEFFIASVSSIVGLGVAPAVEEITAVAVHASFVTCGFIRCRAMIDDPDLVEVVGADEDLVEPGVVVHRGKIGPAGDPRLVEVDVGELRMLTNITIVVFTGVEILDEVVPDVPFPDNVTAGWSSLVDLDEHIWIEWAVDGIRVASRLDGLST